MQTAKRIIDSILAAGTVICAVAMLVIVTIQVVSRFALPQAPAWTEEAARYAFIYMVSFAAALGIGAKAYVGFNALPELLRGRPRLVLQLAMLLAIAGLMGTMFWYSFDFVRVGGLRTAATLGIRMSWVHASTCILSGSTVIYAIIEAARTVSGQAADVDLPVGQASSLPFPKVPQAGSLRHDTKASAVRIEPEEVRIEPEESEDTR